MKLRGWKISDETIKQYAVNEAEGDLSRMIAELEVLWSKCRHEAALRKKNHRCIESEINTADNEAESEDEEAKGG